MPHFHIEVTSSDGEIDGPDPEGITLDGVGAARALVVETLIGLAAETPRSGATRTVLVTARDETGRILVSDSVTVRGRRLLQPDEPGVWRAIAAIRRNT